jgi:hypothetical protein
MSLILSGTDGLSDVDGSAATPAIRGTDANTGMFFPAADTIAFSEGGVESMRIDSSGFVGIGTTSPTTALQVNGTITAPVMADTQGGSVAPISSVMRNRIINGAMVIDQRNAGASVTPTASAYNLDRWRAGISVTSKFSVQQNAGAVTPPVGFTNYLGVTSLSAYTVGAAEQFQMSQSIEGYNIADLDWGTANAKTVTVSFWVRSSLTGTFGGALRNAAANRSYPFSYAINSANTWEFKTITIAGDTTGTWLTTNGLGIQLLFSLGTGSTLSGTAGAWAAGSFVSATGATSVVGTDGATLYITGVQLEVGTQATSFEYRQYGTELNLCQRYYYKTYNSSAAPGTSSDQGAMSAEVLADGTLTRLKLFSGRIPVSMRSQPTVTAYSQTGTADRISVYNNSASTLTVSSIAGRGENSFGFYLNTTSNASASVSYMAQFVASAEL